MAKRKPKIDVTKKINDEYEQERARVEQAKREVDEYHKYREGTTMFGHPSEGKSK